MAHKPYPPGTQTYAPRESTPAANPAGDQKVLKEAVMEMLTRVAHRAQFAERQLAQYRENLKMVNATCHQLDMKKREVASRMHQHLQQRKAQRKTAHYFRFSADHLDELQSSGKRVPFAAACSVDSLVPAAPKSGVGQGSARPSSPSPSIAPAPVFRTEETYLVLPTITAITPCSRKAVMALSPKPPTTRLPLESVRLMARTPLSFSPAPGQLSNPAISPQPPSDNATHADRVATKLKFLRSVVRGYRVRCFFAAKYRRHCIRRVQSFLRVKLSQYQVLALVQLRRHEAAIA
jgi:hypothetical protein